MFLNSFCWRRTWGHLYSSVTEICPSNHGKGPKSEGCSLTTTSFCCSWVISVSDCVGNYLQIWFCSLFLDHILMFHGAITDCRMLILPILWLKVWPTVLQINCTTNQLYFSSCWAVTQVWAWAAGSQPGLLPTGTEHGDGEEQEGDEFWVVLLDPTAAEEWALPQASGIATGQDRNLCRDRLFTQFRQWGFKPIPAHSSFLFQVIVQQGTTCQVIYCFALKRIGLRL